MIASAPLPLGDRHRGLQIAATLCYLMSAFHLLFAVIGAITKVGSTQALNQATLYLLATAATFGIAAYLLRQERRAGAIVAILAAVVRIAMQISVTIFDISIWMLLDITILALIAANWKHLRYTTLPDDAD